MNTTEDKNKKDILPRFKAKFKISISMLVAKEA